MERDRYKRDMGPDIKDNRTIAIAKLNLERMDKEQGAQQSAENSGVERQAKMQGIEQGALTMADQKKTRDMFSAYENEKDPAAKAGLLAMYQARTGNGDKYSAVDGGSSVDPATGLVTKNAPIIFNTGDGRQASAQSRTGSTTITLDMQNKLAPELKKQGISLEDYAKQHGLTIANK